MGHICTWCLKEMGKDEGMGGKWGVWQGLCRKCIANLKASQQSKALENGVHAQSAPRLSRA